MLKRMTIGIALAGVVVVGFATSSLAGDVEERADNRQDRREVVDIVEVGDNVEENVDNRQDRRGEVVDGDVQENVDRRQDRREIIR